MFGLVTRRIFWAVIIGPILNRDCGFCAVASRYLRQWASLLHEPCVVAVGGMCNGCTWGVCSWAYRRCGRSIRRLACVRCCPGADASGATAKCGGSAHGCSF